MGQLPSRQQLQQGEGSEQQSDASGQQQKPRWHLIKRGEAAACLEFGRYPSVPSFTLLHQPGVEPQTVQRVFEETLASFLIKNPILQGRLHKCRDENDKADSVEWWVEEGVQDIRDMYKVVDWSNGGNNNNNNKDKNDKMQHLDSLSHAELWECMNAWFMRDDPPFGCGEDRASSGAPVFEMTLYLFPNGCWGYAIAICHLLVDAYSYYQVLHEFCAEFAGTTAGKGRISATSSSRLNWNSSTIAEKHLFAPQDRAILDTYSVLGAIIRILLKGLFRLLLPFLQTPPKVGLLLFDQQALQGAKNSLLSVPNKENNNSKQHSYLSSNDVMMAAVARACPSHSLLTYACDARPNKHDKHQQQQQELQEREGDCGVCITRVFMSCEAARDPNHIRQTVLAGRYYGVDGHPKNIPISPLLTPTGGLLSWSSWASLPSCRPPVPQWGDSNNENNATTNIRLLCHFPHSNMIRHLPFDVALSFWIAPGQLAIIHNIDGVFANQQHKNHTAASELLGGLTLSSTHDV